MLGDKVALKVVAALRQRPLEDNPKRFLLWQQGLNTQGPSTAREFRTKAPSATQAKHTALAVIRTGAEEVCTSERELSDLVGNNDMRIFSTLGGQMKLSTPLSAAVSNWRDARDSDSRSFQKSMAAHYDASKMQASPEAKLICSHALRQAIKKQNDFHIDLKELPHHDPPLEAATKWAQQRVTDVVPPEGDRAIPLADLKLQVTPAAIEEALIKAIRSKKPEGPVLPEEEPEESESGSDLSGVSEDDRGGAKEQAMANVELMCSTVAPTGSMHFPGTSGGIWVAAARPCTASIKPTNLEKGPAFRIIGMGRNWCPKCKGSQQWQDHFGK